MQHAGRCRRTCDNVLGLFVQDAWTAGRLTLNLGLRFDHNAGILPEQSNPRRPFVGAAVDSRDEADQPEPVRVAHRARLRSDRRRQDRDQGELQPLRAPGRHRPRDQRQPVARSAARPARGPIRTRTASREPNEIGTGCSGFPALSVHYAGPDGPRWPYSDEVTAGVEHQVMKDMRVGVMFYYRTNRDQIGLRNTGRAGQRLHAVHRQRAQRSGRHAGQPEADDGDGLQPAARRSTACRTTSSTTSRTSTRTTRASSSPRNKRFSNRWQMVAGLTIGKNTGGLNTNATGPASRRRATI